MCEGLEDGAVTMHDDETIALVARALSHPARVRIVRLLATQANCRGADVFSELPLAQSTISEHLRVLKEAGLVASHAEGTSMVYCLNPDVVLEVATALDDLVRNSPRCATSALEEQ